LTDDAENLVHSELRPTPAVRARVQSVSIACGLAIATAVAFRGLVGIDPSGAPNHDNLQGVESMLFSPSGSSPLLIFLASAWLFARRARRIRAAIGRPGRPLLAAPLLALAAAGCVWAYYVDYRVLLVPAFSFAVLGAALALGGFEALRAVLLPALFLFFAVPIPPAAINQFMYSLQLATASSAAWGLSLVGLDATHHADLIFHHGKIFQVIESCSGLRTVETLFMSSFLYHDLFFRSRLHSTLLVLSSVAIGLFVNWLRVIGIVLNPYSHFASVHTTQGLVMIVAGVLLLAAMDWLLARWLPRRPWWHRPRTIPALPRNRLVAVVAGMATLAAVTLWVRPWQVQRDALPPLSGFPPKLEGWRASGLKLERDFLGSVAFSEWVHRNYEKDDGESVDLLLGSNRRLDPRVDFSSAKTGVPGSGWSVTSRREETLPSGRTVERLVVESPQGEHQLTYMWQEGVDAPSREILRASLALDRSPWRRSGRALLVRVGTPLAESGDPEGRLREFAGLVEKQLETLSGRGAGPDAG
jgi:exosortase